MLYITIYSVRIFFIVLDIVVLLFLLRTIIPYGKHILNFLVTLMLPILLPMQYLIRHSILHTIKIDLSPYLLLVVLSYLEWLCSIVLKYI